MIIDESYKRIMSKELLKFVKHLEQNGLLSVSMENDKDIDYEEIVYNFLNYDVDYLGTVITKTKK